MTTIAFANAEPLPGYVLTERIGSGGYGEVWRATAPGGVEKAVKTLFGYHDEELAARELKALERVKGVRHPFLLALDRFEIVEDRLIVVTELADMSLDQCFQQHRRQGREGVPRDELLAYLRDAADALDYMHSQYNLQHLDVKPENLLILGRHVKVADFGLVKDVTRQTQNSLVGGMTPTYAAPEVFDNRPGPRTDQYSLAIVYQEMLTGCLPFPGKSPAQLVAQHLQGRPRVAALPAVDQPIVLRALSKAPQDRFASCSQFVNELMHAYGAPDGDSKANWASAASPGDPSPDDTHDRGSACTEVVPGKRRSSRPKWTEPIDPGAARNRPSDAAKSTGRGTPPASKRPSDSAHRLAKLTPFRRREDWDEASDAAPANRTIDISVSSAIVDLPSIEADADGKTSKRTLLIGVGGAGGGVLRRVRRRLLAADAEAPWPELAPMLVVDTDDDDLKSLREKMKDGQRSWINMIALPLKRPQEYRDQPPESLHWLSRRWLYNIPRSLKTRGYRPLGRLALIDNARLIVGELERILRAFAPATEEEAAGDRSLTLEALRSDPVRVIVVASTSGGTGGGAAIDVAYAVRRVADELKLSDVEIVGVFGDCHGRGNEANKLALANSYAFLTELATVWQSGNRGENELPELNVFEGDGPPFDHVYFAGSLGANSLLDGEQWIDQAALYLSANVDPKAAALLAECRQRSNEASEDAAGGPLIRSFAAASLDESRDVLERRARERICRLATDLWRRPPQTSLDGKHPADDDPAARFRKRNWFGRRKKKHDDDDQPEVNDEMINGIRALVSERFGDASSGAFAAWLFSAILDRIETKPSLLVEEKGAALTRLIHRCSSLAVQELNDVVCRMRETDEERVVSARCLNSESVDHSDEPDMNETARSIVELVGRNVCKSFIEPLLLSDGKQAPELGELLWNISGDIFSRMRSDEKFDENVLSLAGPSVDIPQIVAETVIRPHRCGHERRTIVVAPDNWRSESLKEAVGQHAPSAAFLTSSVATPLFIREASQMSLYQTAARLADQQPDVHVAANRLRTRDDIEWRPLLRVTTHDG